MADQPARVTTRANSGLPVVRHERPVSYACSEVDVRVGELAVLEQVAAQVDSPESRVVVAAARAEVAVARAEVAAHLARGEAERFASNAGGGR